MNYQRVDGWIIAISDLGSYQSSGARALISLGVDVAIVTGTEKQATRSSLRSTNRFYSETGIQLGELVNKISKELEGEGSGHPTAAGFNGSCSVDEFNNSIFEEIKNLLAVKN
jgi:nanoRNase/pAp phosphatase (c-di-AMP/oligoRNAs hydrolase)